MLVLTRRANERIWIDGGRIVVTLVEVTRDGRARLGVDAPPDVRIDREEVARRKAADERGPSCGT